MQPVGEFTRIPLAADIDLHLHRIALYKTVRVDICISEELRPQRNSRLALISRLLERGTRDLPDLQTLNRFIDDLYGAHYYAEVDRLGDYQFIHLCLEVIDEKFLERAGGDVLARGVGFLHDILLAPAGDSSGFHREYLEQEKLILTLVRMPDEVTFNLRQLHMIAIKLTHELWRPAVTKARELISQIHNVHFSRP